MGWMTTAFPNKYYTAKIGNEGHKAELRYKESCETTVENFPQASITGKK